MFKHIVTHTDSCYSSYIVLISLSSALSLSGEEVEETVLPGLAVDCQTFFCANVIENSIIQVCGGMYTECIVGNILFVVNFTMLCCDIFCLITNVCVV